MAAGVPSSQIYVDKSPSLKNATNPMGLMVANRRDEPAGGFQGINRARKEGANPMMYGAAGGFVPNFRRKRNRRGVGAEAPTDAPSEEALPMAELADSTQEVVKGNRDMLGIIFGVQAGLSALTGATEGAVGGLGVLTNGLSSAAGTATTALFTIQGLSQAFGGAEKGVGKFIGALGPYGAAAGFLYTGYQELAKYLDKTNPEIQKAAAASNRLAEAADKAAINLNTINPATKERIEEESKTNLTLIGEQSYKENSKLLREGTGGVEPTLTQLSANLLKGLVRGGTTGSRRSDVASDWSDALTDQITNAMSQARGVGMSSKEINQIAMRYAQEGDLNYVGETQITPEEAEKLFSELTNIVSSIGQAGSPQSIIRGLSDEQKKQFAAMTPEEVGKSIAARDTTDEKDAEARAKLKPLQDAFYMAGVKDDPARQEAIRKTIKLLRDQEEAEKDAKKEAIANAPIALRQTIKAIQREKIERESIRKIDQQIAKDRYDSSLLVAGIETDLTLSASERAIKTIEAQAALEKQTAELEAQKTIQADINELVGKFADNVAFKTVKGGESAARAALSALSQDSGAQNLLNINTSTPGGRKEQEKRALAMAENQLIGTALAPVEGAAQALADALLLSLNLTQKTKEAVRDGNIEKEKSKQLEIAKNKIQEQNNRASEKYAQRMSEIANDISNESARVGFASQIENAKVDVRLAQLSKTTGISPFARQDEQRRLENLKFQNELKSEREKNILDAKAELTRNSKIDDNISALNQNGELTKENTEALIRLKEAIMPTSGEPSSDQSAVSAGIAAATALGEDSSILEKTKAYFQAYTKAAFAPRAAEPVGTEPVKTVNLSSPEIFAKAEELSNIKDAQQRIAAAKAYTDELELSVEASQRLQDNLLKTAQLLRSGIDTSTAKENLRKLEEQIKAITEAIESIGKTEKGQLEDQLKALQDSPSTFAEGMENGFLQMQVNSEQFAYLLGKDIPKMFSDGISSAINSAVEGTVSLKDGLRSAAYEFVKTINQRTMSNLVDKIVGGGGGGSGGLVQGIASMFMASGGMVNGGSGSKDDVPAMLMGGEYVVNKKAVSKYGAQFLESVNNGTLTGYAKGGSVQRGPQGNFYTPGTFGQGAIEGKRNLLDFATQTGTTGQFDKMINQSGYQAIDLEPESSRLSVSGMRNSPQFEATQAAKGQAFDLYLQQYNAEIAAKKAEKEQKKAFRKQLMMLAISAVAAPVLGAAGAGFGAAFKGASGQGFMSQLGAGFKGIFTGGSIGGQQVGGLGNLFSSAGKAFTGDFTGASNQFKLSQIGNSSQLADLYKSDKGFASYIDSMGGFDTSGALKAAPAGFGGVIPSGIASAGKGVVQSGNVDNSLAYDTSPIPELPRGYDNAPWGSGASSFYEPYSLYGRRSGGNWMNLTSRFGSYGLFPPIPRATGGMIPSTSGIDTVPAMLSGGEFVMNRSAVQEIGASSLQSMNSGGTSITSEETSKKLNEQLLAKLDELIKASGSTGDITINVAPSGQTTQETSQDPSAGRQQLARQIKDAVLQVINDEKRIGGTLRR
jgi:hypothetical protein